MYTYMEVTGSVLLECLLNAARECGIREMTKSKFYVFFSDVARQLKEAGCEIECEICGGFISLQILMDGEQAYWDEKEV